MSVHHDQRANKSRVQDSSQFGDTVPPHDLDAEQCVLGCCLLDAEKVDEVAQVLSRSDFYAMSNQYLWDAITSLHGTGQAVDVVTVANAMQAKGHLWEAGGPAYLNQVLASVPHTAHARYYAESVRVLAYRRRSIECARDMIRDSYDLSKSPEQVVQTVEERITKLMDDNSADTVETMARTLLEIGDALDTATPSGLSTGLTKLDELCGGFRPGQLIVLAARPRIGKTMLAMCLARHWVMQNRPILFFTLELTRTELVGRMISNQTNITTQQLCHPAALSADDRANIRSASQLMAEWPLLIDDRSGINIPLIASASRLAKRQSGIQVVIVDYLQIIDPTDAKVSREQQVSMMSRSLKRLAKEMNLPIVVLAQLNRELEKRSGASRKPQLSDLRESGAIENDADLVLMLHREAEYMDSDDLNYEDEQHRAELFVRKNRSGPAGKVDLYCDLRRYEFNNLALPHYSQSGNPYWEPDEDF